MLHIYMNLHCSTRRSELVEATETLTKRSLFTDDVQFDSLTLKLAQSITQYRILPLINNSVTSCCSFLLLSISVIISYDSLQSIII